MLLPCICSCLSHPFNNATLPCFCCSARRREEKLRKQREKRLLGLGVPQWEIDKIEATDNPELGAIELEDRWLEELEKKMGITKAYQSKDDEFLSIGGGIFEGTGRADDPEKVLTHDETAPLLSKTSVEEEDDETAPLLSKMPGEEEEDVDTKTHDETELLLSKTPEEEEEGMDTKVGVGVKESSESSESSESEESVESKEDDD